MDILNQLQNLDDEHKRRIEQYVKRLEKLYNDVITKLSQLGEGAEVADGALFNWNQIQSLRARANRIFSDMAGDMGMLIKNGNSKEWLAASSKNDVIANKFLRNSSSKASDTEKYYQRNLEALKGFNSRKQNGLGLSDRVWNYTNQFKLETELSMDLAAGMGEGMSAGYLATYMKKYLKEPDMLFRRVENKRGKLVLSQAAQNYNPGPGVYRSSYKNSVRLTRTEINMAYRTSDNLRWQQLDFVVGKEIKLSNAHKIPDICDTLAGLYPKDFVFVGWHPQCMCYSIPRLMSEDEYNKFEQQQLDGKPITVESDNEVKNVPKAFNNWVENNKDRIANAKSSPYFMRDNPKYANGKYQPPIKVVAKTETKKAEAIKDVAGLNDQVKKLAEVNKDWFARGFVDIKASKGTTYNGATDMNGRITLSSSRLKECINAFNNINQGVTTTLENEDALSTLWHEITHNKNKQPLPKLTHNMTRTMELANEFVSRNTLPDFMKALGGELQNKSLITNRKSTGYNTWVRNYDTLIEITKADKAKVLADVEKYLINESYTTQKQGLIDAIVNNAQIDLQKSEVNNAIMFCLDKDEKTFKEEITKLFVK